MITRPIMNLATVSWRRTALASEVSPSTLGSEVVGIVAIVHLLVGGTGTDTGGLAVCHPGGGGVGNGVGLAPPLASSGVMIGNVDLDFGVAVGCTVGN